MGVKFEYRPVPKPQHKRRVKKNKRFTEKMIREIFERDNYQCVRCGSYHLEAIPHHIIYRSAGGDNSKRNGVTICRTCHDMAHSKREVRRWFEEWQENNLDENGDRS